MPRQVAIHVPDDVSLETIDAAAKAAGETRSSFILKAALLRANGMVARMSPKDRKALSREIGEAVLRALRL